MPFQVLHLIQRTLTFGPIVGYGWVVREAQWLPLAVLHLWEKIHWIEMSASFSTEGKRFPCRWYLSRFSVFELFPSVPLTKWRQWKPHFSTVSLALWLDGLYVLLGQLHNISTREVYRAIVTGYTSSEKLLANVGSYAVIIQDLVLFAWFRVSLGSLCIALFSHMNPGTLGTLTKGDISIRAQDFAFDSHAVYHPYLGSCFSF